MKRQWREPRTRNTRSTLNKGRDRTRAHQRTHRNRERIHTIRNRAPLEVHRNRIPQPSELRHRVQSSSRVQNIDIQHRDESVPHPAIAVVEIDGTTDELERTPGDDLLEEVEGFVAGVGMGESSDRGRTGPGDDGGEEDADEDGALDAVHHQEGGQETMHVPHKFSMKIDHRWSGKREMGLTRQRKYRATSWADA